ncbi:MAG: hypothetical protein JNM34_09355, partial [Chthonomonadaceae bacterium]|nr:hypothetical protein [Chthonomonadaceae bacterium]
MSSTVEPTVANLSESLFGIEGLVGHLRSTKHSTTARPEVLAQQFGLPEGFVQDVLDALHRPHSAQHRTRAAWRSAWTAIGTVYFKARGAWLWATEKPIWFVVVTGGAAYLANFLTYAYALSQTSTQGRIVVQYGAVFLWVYALHLLSFARHGKLRFPVIGGGLLVVVNLLTSLRSGGLGVANSAMSNLASFLAYSVPGAIAALIGGYVRASKQETALRTLSRQEAMQKLFGLRESLKKSQSPIDRARDQDSFIARLFAARTWPLQAILTGFVVGLLRTFCIWVYQV